jgi:hypothetical protein
MVKLVHQDHPLPSVRLHDVEHQPGMVSHLESRVAEETGIGGGDDRSPTQMANGQPITGYIGEERCPSFGSLPLKPDATLRLDGPHSIDVSRRECRREAPGW